LFSLEEITLLEEGKVKRGNYNVKMRKEEWLELKDYLERGTDNINQPSPFRMMTTNTTRHVGAHGRAPLHFVVQRLSYSFPSCLHHAPLHFVVQRSTGFRGYNINSL
jgi:hypothetical protein